MREITEAQAQELANLLQMVVTNDTEPMAFTMEPIKAANGWLPCDEENMEDSWGVLPIHIISTRPWTEQIWRPKAK